MTSEALLTLAAILSLAFFVEATLGFGAILVSVALGALVVPLDRLLPLVVALNLVLSSYVLSRDHRAVDRALLLRGVLPLMAVGLPVGMLLFHAAPGNALLVVLGAGVALLAALELARSHAQADAPAAPLARPLRAGFLLAGGVVHGLFGTGGPLVVYVVGRQLPDKSAFRGTLAALWLTLNAALLAGHALAGKLDGEAARSALLLLPAALLGIGLGDWAHRRIPARPFRLLVHVLLLGSGLRLALG